MLRDNHKERQCPTCLYRDPGGNLYVTTCSHYKNIWEQQPETLVSFSSLPHGSGQNWNPKLNTVSKTLYKMPQTQLKHNSCKLNLICFARHWSVPLSFFLYIQVIQLQKIPICRAMARSSSCVTSIPTCKGAFRDRGRPRKSWWMCYYVDRFPHVNCPSRESRREHCFCKAAIVVKEDSFSP